MFRGGRWLVLMVALAALAPASAAAAAEPTVDPAPEPQTVSCQEAESKSAGEELEVGDYVRDGAAGAAVPEPGETVAADILLVDGSATLTVTTEDDGSVVVENCGAELQPPPVDPLSLRGKQAPVARISSPAECSDSAYGFTGMRWYWPYAWYLKTDTIPAGLSVANVTNAIIEGTQSITSVRNKCGLFDNVPAEQRYDGPTNGWANINSNGCLTNDWHNATDFAGGAGDINTLAVTCTWSYGDGSDAAGSSDMRFNDYNYDWMPDGTGTCGGRYVIRAVAAHERGHTFGLGHVGEGSHGNLTMSELIGTCSDQEFWLGRGDVLGMRARYPF